MAAESQATVALALAIARARQETRPVRLLFVCTGNICRSPLAHAVFDHLCRERQLEHLFETESAGTHGYHIGDNADERMRRTAKSHGVLVDHLARKVSARDLSHYDLILAMDSDHLGHLRRLADSSDRARIVLYRNYETGGSEADVPDPYYEGPAAFEQVYGIVSAVSAALLERLLIGMQAAAADATDAAP